MTAVPYWARIAVLAGLALIMIAIERMRDKGSTNRTWEYGTIFAIGAIGAIYGAVNDLITSNISPAYFLLGKGLDGVPSIRADAMQLGAQAGFGAAAIACAVWLFVLRRVPAKLRCIAVFKALWIPFVCAVVLSLIGALLLKCYDPMEFTEQLVQLNMPQVTAGFIQVWWIHMGAYVGLFLGVITAMLVTLKRSAKSQIEPSLAP